jgi:Flp pilus assembly protein protease CpaA
VDIALLLLAIPICIADMHSLVIPNIYTKTLFYVALIQVCLFGFGPIRALIVSAVILILLLIFGTGMGDIKLLGLILISHTYSAIEFIAGILLLALVHIVVLMGIHRRIPSKIPLAPSIFMGIVTYLATR